MRKLIEGIPWPVLCMVLFIAAALFSVAIPDRYVIVQGQIDKLYYVEHQHGLFMRFRFSSDRTYEDALRTLQRLNPPPSIEDTQRYAPAIPEPTLEKVKR